MTSSRTEIVLEFMDRVWTKADVSAIYELFADHAKVQGLEDVVHASSEEFSGFHRMMTTQFADIQVKPIRTVEQGEWVSLWTKIEAVEKATGRKIDFEGTIMSRVVDGRVVEGHNLMDFMTMFEQLGRLPDRARDLCLMGEKLTLA